MGAFETAQDKLVRRPVQVLRMTVDKCALTFGVAPCTVSAATGKECYNTFKTCQDTANYDRTTTPLLFCTSGRRLGDEDYRPLLASVSLTPTMVETNKTVRARLSATLVDELDTDVGMDPYVDTRLAATKRKGTFFKKLWQRQGMALRGRPVEMLEGYADIDFADYVVRFTGVMDNRPRFDSNGRFIIEAVDLLGDLLNKKTHNPSTAKLAAAITAGSSSITLTDVVGFSVPSGYVKIEDELVYYTSITEATGVITGLTRGAQGTTAAAHSQDTQTQWVKVYDGNGFDLMVSILEDDAGFTALQVDETAFAYWRDWPGDDTGVENEMLCFIAEPTTLNDVLFRLADSLDAKVWQNENGMITCRRNIPNEPGRVYDEITDDENIIQKSPKVDLNLKSQFTRVIIYWYPRALAKFGDEAGYIRQTMVVDAEAESADAGNTVIPLKIYAPFIRLGESADEVIEGYIRDMGLRRLFRTSEPQEIVEIEVDPRDSSILSGEFVHLTTEQIINMDGTGIVQGVFQVVERDPAPERIKLKLLRIHRRRYAMWAPDSHPDYADATEEEREYGYWCNDNGDVGDAEKTRYCWH